MASTNLVQYHRMKGCPDEARNVLQERYFIQQQEVAECLKLLNLYLEGLGYETWSGVESISHPSMVGATGSEADIPGSTEGIDAAEATRPAPYQNVAGAEATIPDPTTVRDVSKGGAVGAAAPPLAQKIKNENYALFIEIVIGSWLPRSISCKKTLKN